MTMSSALRAAYRATCVRVGRRRFAVGEAAPSLAIVTAYNPGSRGASPSINRAADRALHGELQRRGYRCERAQNAPGTAWAEPSWAIYGIRASTALALAERFGQLAIYATHRRKLALVYRQNGTIVRETACQPL